MLFPIVVLLGVNGLVVGILNSYEHFALPAIAPLVWNVVIIVVLVALKPLFDGPDQLYAYAIGVLAGTTVQLLMVLPMLPRVGFHFEWAFDWRDPRVIRVFRLMLPVTIGLGVINFDLLINSSLGTLVSDQAPRAIDAAFRIYMLPQGMFSVAIATVLFPALSPPRRPARPARAAPHDGDRRAAGLPAADPGGRLHDRAGDADHATRLPARLVRRRVDRAGLDRALLVLLQPAVRGREPAAHAHVLLAAAAMDADRARCGEPRRQRRRQPRALPSRSASPAS